MKRKLAIAAVIALTVWYGRVTQYHYPAPTTPAKQVTRALPASRYSWERK